MAFALSSRAPVAARAAAARPAASARRAVAPARRSSGLAPSRFAAPAPALFTVEATKRSVGDLKKADLEGKVVLVSGCARARIRGQERRGMELAVFFSSLSREMGKAAGVPGVAWTLHLGPAK